MNVERWHHSLAGLGVAVADTPARICGMCVESLGVTGSGISVVTKLGNRGVVCSTNEVAARIEDLQFTLGEGPCIDAVNAGGPVLVADVRDPGDVDVGRWTAFMAAAESSSVRAVFAFPLRVGAVTVGALDLYRDAAGPLSAEELACALLASDAAALALVQLHAGRDDQLSSTVGPTYDAHVHAATGMVQVQLGVRTEDALLAIRARAFADGRSLADTARDVVERRLRFSAEDQ